MVFSVTDWDFYPGPFCVIYYTRSNEKVYLITHYHNVLIRIDTIIFVTYL